MVNRKETTFVLNGTLPKQIIVRGTTPENHTPRLFSVILDYDWVEKIICSDCYLTDANDIAYIIGEFLFIPYTEFKEIVNPPLPYSYRPPEKSI